MGMSDSFDAFGHVKKSINKGDDRPVISDEKNTNKSNGFDARIYFSSRALSLFKSRKQWTWDRNLSRRQTRSDVHVIIFSKRQFDDPTKT